LQLSAVHSLPSEQETVACEQPDVILQESLVHALPSSQLVAAGVTQLPDPLQAGAATNPSFPHCAEPHIVPLAYF
jgi:hypothetical protein